MRQPRLRTRLAIWFAASLLLILTPVLLGVLWMQGQAMRRSLDHHLEEDLEVAAEMVVIRNGAYAWRTEVDRDRGYDAGVQRWVEVFGTDGVLAFVRGTAAESFIRTTLAPASADSEGYRTLTTPAGASVRTLTRQHDLGSLPVWIRVARSEDDLRRDLRRLMLIFAIVAPLAVLGAALAGYVISGRALAPLTRMADRARFIRAEHLSERLIVENPSDELGQLALVFNDTLARLQESFERLKRFSADASHELRTPLTAIRSVGEVGLREAHTHDDYREVIGSMLEEADRLNRLVDTLLTLSRWEGGRVQLAPVALDLGRVVRVAISQLIVLAEERRITIAADIRGTVVGHADPLMVRQAVMNVIDNAIKYTPEGGHIRVVVSGTPEVVHVVVDDEGPGIPRAERARVLERFYRIGGGGMDAASGSGLGLAIVAWVMDAHHGRVEIADAPSGGTRVVLTLPIGRPVAGA